MGVSPGDRDPALASLPPIVLFDGVCNLCNAAVRFIIENDRIGDIRFASLQSDVAAALLGASQPTAFADPGTIVFLEDGRRFERSTAALRIARHLGGLWPLLGILEVVPAPVRDAVYDFIAARRYGWFGRSVSCRVPAPTEARRFLDVNVPGRA